MRTLFFLLLFCPLFSELQLKENFQTAKTGDYIVTRCGKTYTLMLIGKKTPPHLTIEEISAPTTAFPKKQIDWRSWVENDAPNNTCWVRYTLDMNTGLMQNAYSFTTNQWYRTDQSNAFLTTLLNLPFVEVPGKERKKRGNIKSGELWQPQMICNGTAISGVFFNAYKAIWPNDKSDLSQKEVLIYIPQESDQYPSYFPYWLQVSGNIEKGKLRISDSGRGLKSPKP
jgi:hypothetical protein